MEPMRKLQNAVVFITGASSGIGAACAHAFAAEGARLLLAARRLDRLQQMEPGLRAAGAADVHTLALDVRQADAVAAAIGALAEPWRDIEILVNNAGLSRGHEKLYTGNLHDWEEMIDTNIKGVL